MITRKDLDNLMYLKQEVKHLQSKIENYRPAEIVVDSVKGSSPVFPYTEHTIKIEGLELKKDTLSEYYSKLRELKEKLSKEEQRIEEEIQNIPFSEIRLIIKYKYLEGLNYIQIMNKMGYGAPETPRIKLFRYFEGKEE